MVIRRFDIWLVSLDPTVGHEVRKTRPCVVVSPDSFNRHIQTFITIPMTSKGMPYPNRVDCRFRGKDGQIMVDRIRACDRLRFIRKLGRLDPATSMKVLEVLQEMFAP